MALVGPHLRRISPLLAGLTHSLIAYAEGPSSQIRSSDGSPARIGSAIGCRSSGRECGRVFEIVESTPTRSEVQDNGSNTILIEQVEEWARCDRYLTPETLARVSPPPDSPTTTTAPGLDAPLLQHLRRPPTGALERHPEHQIDTDRP